MALFKKLDVVGLLQCDKIAQYAIMMVDDLYSAHRFGIPGAVCVLGSYVFGHFIPFPEALQEFVSTATTWLLTAAMVGLGLTVSLRDLRERAMLPLAAMTITSILLAVFAYLAV